MVQRSGAVTVSLDSGESGAIDSLGEKGREFFASAFR